MSTHRTFDGEWAACKNRDACNSPIHVDIAPEEAERLPGGFLEQLAEAADPPTETWKSGRKVWHDSAGEVHRDYDLPAIIEIRGIRIWHRHGLIHRDGGKPAVIRADGTLAWWSNGRYIRDNDPNSTHDEAWSLPKETLQRLTAPTPDQPAAHS